jgi:hypothetical protein
MQIEGVPEGFEIRTVYDAQSLADAIVQGDQTLKPGERVVCAIIRRVEPVCTWQHGVFEDGWIAEDQSGEICWWTEKPVHHSEEPEWVRPRRCVVHMIRCANLLLKPPIFRSDLPWTERVQQVGPTIEATLKVMT